MKSYFDDHVIDVWFRLRDDMLKEGNTASAVRPPSLRDAIYAWSLAQRSGNETSPETIEAWVNGVELGAMAALRDAWKTRR